MNVTGADDAPVAVDDANSITAGNAPVSGNLLANDTDAEGDTLSVSAVDQATSNSTTITVDGTYGELVVTKATGAYTYTLGVTTSEAAAVAALGQGATQQDQFTYTASDGTLGTNAHLTVDVTGSAPATSGSAAVTLGPADFNFDGHTYATGPVATANIGNGSDDGVTLVGSVNWNGGGDAGHVQVIVYNGNPSVSGSGLFGEVTANGLDLQILAGGSAIVDTGVTLASGQWYNVALTHENGTFTLYVDGAVAYTGDAFANGIPNPSYPNEPEAMFVAGDGGENFNGAVANVSVWNTALTQAQVQGTDFNALTGSESGLVAYYPLNDGSGTTVADAINSAGNLQISNDGQGSGSWTSATGDTTLTISADNQQHQVFPFLNITGTGPTIQSAIVTWNITGDGTVSSEGVDVGGNPYGITITFDPNAGGPGVAGYRLVGSATVADYENVLSHLTFQTSQGQSGTTFTVTVNDGTGDTATETSTLNVFGINEGPQTASVSDGGNWYATGQLTVSNPGTGDTWSIAGGHNYTASSNYHFGIDEFSVVNTDGGTPTTIFDDSFNGTVPPAGPAIQNASSPSGVSYSDFGSGTYVQGTGEALLEGSNAGYVGSALGSGTNYGKPVFGQFTTLLTGTSYNTTDPTDGLRSGQSFTAGGLFDLTTPPDTVSRYGIRLSDRDSSAANPANDQPGTETIDLGISRSANNQAVAVLTEYNFETGVSTVLQSITINNPHSDNEILLSLSNDAANNGVIVASYQLENNGVAERRRPSPSGPSATSSTMRTGPGRSFTAVSTRDNSGLVDPDRIHAAGNLRPARSRAGRQLALCPEPGPCEREGVGRRRARAGQLPGPGHECGWPAKHPDHFGQRHRHQRCAGRDRSGAVQRDSGTPISACVNTGLSVSDPDDGGKTETVTLSVERRHDLDCCRQQRRFRGSSPATAPARSRSRARSRRSTRCSTAAASGRGTIVYTDNAASPGFSSAATLTLTIDDNGSNGGTALSDSASATINIAPPGGTPNWDREIDPFATAVTANTTQWVIPNSRRPHLDGLQRR